MSVVVIVPESNNKIVMTCPNGGQTLILQDTKDLQVLDRGVNGAVASVNGMTGHVIIDTGEPILTYIAGSVVNGFRAVYTDNNGEVNNADSSDGSQIGRVAGISLNASNAGGFINVRSYGILEDASFSFTPGAMLYFDANGILTETAPTGSVFYQMVGRAETATRIFITIEEPIMLN